MINPRFVSTKGPENHWAYNIPTYAVTGDGIEDCEQATILLCRGSKDDPTKPRQVGMFTESLLEVCRQYLTSQNVGEMATRETSQAITKIDEALMWINKRSEDRRMRGVQATYKS